MDRLCHSIRTTYVHLLLHHRHYKSPSFALKLLDSLRILHVPSWSNAEISSQDIRIHKVSGSLTNAVFFVSCPFVRGTRTLLLRIYGASSDSLISRPRELHTLHILSSQYHIGPRVYGTFENGRIEEYFESTTLSASDIREPRISRWIGARMAELHSVDIEVVEDTSLQFRGEGMGWGVGVKKNVKSWLDPAQEVLALSSVSAAIREELDLKRFKEEWAAYTRWLSTVDDVNHGSRRVFAHNDAQYGNLLRLKHLTEGLDEHRQVCATLYIHVGFSRWPCLKIVVVDFEYASPNPASFDIANHFHEWTADYHGSTPHLLDPSRYPSFKERRNFYIAYLQYTTIFGEDPIVDKSEREVQIARLDDQVRVWSPASHAMWAIWGLVQAREDLEANGGEVEFDYVAYSRCRMAGFRREIRALGLDKLR